MKYFLRCEDWQYRGEGNDHIILNYLGDDKYLLRKILRIKKKSENIQQQLNQLGFDEILRNQIYKRNDLLSKYVVQSGTITNTNSDFINDLKIKIQPFRPQKRLHKDIDESTDFYVEEDFSLYYFNNEQQNLLIGFEIKPKSPVREIYSRQCAKENFLKNSKLQHDFKTFDKFYNTICQDQSVFSLKYFKKQLQKLQDKSIEQISMYDPRNFFSNDEKLIQYSLKQLVNNPQNNFSCEHNSATDIDSKFALKLLTNIILQESQMIKIIQQCQELFQSCSQNMPSILEKYSSFMEQSLFRDFQFQIVNEIFSELNEEIGQKNYTQNEIELINKIQVEKQQIIMDLTQQQNQLQDFKLVLKSIIRFLFSYTFRDLSIIVKIIISSQNQPNLLNECGFNSLKNDYLQINPDDKIYYKTGIVDTELKKIQKLITISNEESKLFQLYINHIFLQDIINDM